MGDLTPLTRLIIENSIDDDSKMQEPIACREDRPQTLDIEHKQCKLKHPTDRAMLLSLATSELT